MIDINKLVNIESTVFDLLRKNTLRIGALGVPVAPHPCEYSPDSQGAYRLGYSCNLLNNNYLFCKIARSQGVNADLFLDPKFLDITATSLPFWEEVEYQSKTMPSAEDVMDAWQLPSFVKVAKWSLEFYTAQLARFDFRGLSRIFKGGLDIRPGDETGYMYAYSALPHRDMMCFYSGVDVLHVSGSHIGLAAISGKPYVTFPYGADLFTLPFEDSELGWMQASGFRKASRHIVSGGIMMEYMQALGINKRLIALLPFMVDTDTYAPLQNNEIKDALKKEYPGKTIILLGARQNWAWKGSGKFLKALGDVAEKRDDVVVLCVWYGQDVDKSERFIAEIGLENKIVKMGVVSKPLLRKYIDAVDVCVDQFTHGGLGTFALESLSIGKPLITHYNAEKHFRFEENPPVINSFSVEEIAEAIRFCVDNPNEMKALGEKSRSWLCKYHGHKVLWPAYDAEYRRAISERIYRA